MRPLASACICLTAAVLLGGCVPSGEEAPDTIPSFAEDTLLGDIQADGELVVAVPSGAPPLSFSPRPGAARGLAVEVGRWIARGLGVEATFVPESPNRLVAMVEDDEADIAFPPTPITTASLRETTFSDPYYLGHQRLLVPQDSSVRDVYDLAGERVCSVPAPTEVALDQIVPSIEVVETASVRECADAVAGGEVAAGTASDLALMGVVRKNDDLQITGDELNTQGYGVVLEPGASTAADFIDRLLAKAKGDDVFLDWYAKWVGPHIVDPLPEAPELSAEEAATLFPEETLENG